MEAACPPPDRGAPPRCSLPKDGSRKKWHLCRVQSLVDEGEASRSCRGPGVITLSARRNVSKGRERELLFRSLSPVQMVAVKIPAGARSCKVNTSGSFLMPEVRPWQTMLAGLSKLCLGAFIALGLVSSPAQWLIALLKIKFKTLPRKFVEGRALRWHQKLSAQCSFHYSGPRYSLH